APLPEYTGTPSTKYTERGSKIERLTKVDDPDQFFDETEKDKLDFDGWRLGVEAQLRDNADWFPTLDQKINYIMHRLAGKASKETIPFLKSSNPERFKSAKSMLDHLEAQFGDPDRIRKAENEWDKLQMKDPESYGNKYNDISYIRFRNAFFRLSAELQKPRTEWQSAFERRISPTLQKALALQFQDDSIDFDTISNLTAKVNFTFTSADAELQAKRDEKKTFKNAANRQVDSLLGVKLTEENFICEANDQDFLNKRLGGKSWTIACTIARNGFSSTTSNALLGTGASGYLFISRDMAKKALEYLNPQRVTDFPPSPVVGFDCKATQLIDVALIMNLKINGRELINVPFLVINMKHDLILGRKWFEDHGVVIDCREKLFLYREWPTITASEDIPMDEKVCKTRNPEDNDIEPKNVTLGPNCRVIGFFFINKTQKLCLAAHKGFLAIRRLPKEKKI
ncbi:hypothetical protein GcM3_181023, partial [Golovinomyces cichoracearum]